MKNKLLPSYRIFHWLNITFLIALAILLSTTFSGCASTEYVTYGFAFQLDSDNQDAALLDYRYGNKKHVSIAAPEWAVTKGETFVGQHVLQPMLRGEYLYIKWKNLPTGQIYEDTVDLRSRLPTDITGHEVYFMIYGPQLYVYLISPERRPPDMPPIGPRMTQYRKTVQMYPDKHI